MAHPVDERIRWAVGLILAGCTPAQTPPPPELGEPDASWARDAPPPVIDASAPLSDASTSSATETPPPLDADAVVMAVVDAAPAIDASALCAAYVKTATANPKGPKTQSPTADHAVPRQRLGNVGDVTAHAQGGQAVCRIVWERSSVSRTVMVAPRCCPPFHGPCPPASPVSVAGERTKVETAFVGADGKATSSALVWETWANEPPPQPYCGRMPEGFVARPRHDASLGGALAELAELEAASVHAFVRLAAELAGLGAPRALVRRARAAARDEVRHARVAARLARAHGATPRRLTRRPWTARTPRAIAEENAVEGCVHETFGAAVATYQAARAPTAALRAFFATIADDERAHAALAEDVAHWLEPRLDASDRASVSAARVRAARRVGRARATASLMPPLSVMRTLAASLFG